MSEEKLYAVKNEEGKYLDFGNNGVYKRFGTANRPVTRNYIAAREIALPAHGYVVTFVEEPEKVVLTKEQAEIVEGANESQFPANYISDNTVSSYAEKLLMNAYVNGYTVAKEKKYNVKVPHTKDVWYYKESEAYLQTICPADDKKLRGKFTESEIEHYGLQDCKKEEVTDDAD